MRIPQKRFGFAGRRQRSRFKYGKIFLLSAALAAAGLGGYWLLVNGLARIPASGAAVRKTVLALWEAGDYQEIIRITEGELSREPMDAYNLIFNGFAHFYTGANQTTTEERLEHIDAAIKSLRRARLHSRTPLAGELDYVLGKAYYQKGEFYADLSAEYMESSLARNFVGQDSYEYLGFAYKSLGEYTRSIEFLHKAGVENPSGPLFLALAQTYYQTGDTGASQDALMRAINLSQDSSVSQRARALLGDIYLRNKDYAKSEEQFLRILEENPQSADAYFNLGEIYSSMGDSVKARANWRRARRIDPNHAGALKRL
ncbi:MAG: tetratricopeptide repeat protein [Spirochaetales bacterium]|jgi:tetratricopeptide (TPR) repeat protein|nr:tetratricopeptide repeat protein [Spirochaetales bacterium]